MSEGNTLSEKINFGKHKGKTFAAIMKTDATYLCWLRDDVAKTKRQSFFDKDANDALDRWLERAAKSVGGKYRNWTTNPPDFAAMRAQVEVQITGAAMQTQSVIAQALPVAFAGYGDEWGAF
jgi:hypothetical protein